ncbi:RraA family protein [Paenibacillus xerothermodurans]|uniref:Putative 4-hydroxy-4-methyl-2-oxoglutarate aldolase n=1 Tax=Paenibacillus xerothermodurans TaxID=1977292 RepID=A0A2W1P5A0_PAEXE|nr:RraA family protein [Paenibacillus xerothermodurans]PZE22348.1 RraA family protein [Paenibacillus xerothermodurans]
MAMSIQEMVREFMKTSTPTVSDALDRLQIRGGCHGLAPIVQGKKIVGPAFTVKYVPIGEEKGTVGDYIDDVGLGEVIVLDNGGRTDCTVWGDILTYVAASKGIAGTIIDGVCRDVDGIRGMDYPMFSRGQYMVTGKDRVMVQSVNQTVSIANVQVRQGDLIMADDSGVLVIPHNRAEEVLAVALQIEEAEQRILADLKNGATVAEARKTHKYNELQRAQVNKGVSV